LVISRAAFLSGDDTRVMEEIVRVKEVCGEVHLKVILETAELGSYEHVRHASLLAMEAWADFVKTSTGKAACGATPGVTLVMLEAIRDYKERSGRPVGMKAAGGVPNSKAALHRLALVKETLGDEWLTHRMSRLAVRKTYKLYVGGAFVRSESGRYDPVQGRNVPRGSRKDVRDAVKAARSAAGPWAARTAYNRGQVIYRAAEVPSHAPATSPRLPPSSRRP
jgi:deoxyribose-phosphate aldolase